MEYADAKSKNVVHNAISKIVMRTGRIRSELDASTFEIVDSVACSDSFRGNSLAKRNFCEALHNYDCEEWRYFFLRRYSGDRDPRRKLETTYLKLHPDEKKSFEREAKRVRENGEKVVYDRKRKDEMTERLLNDKAMIDALEAWNRGG